MAIFIKLDLVLNCHTIAYNELFKSDRMHKVGRAGRQHMHKLAPVYQ
jgi:hypothetical protein